MIELPQFTERGKVKPRPKTVFELELGEPFFRMLCKRKCCTVTLHKHVRTVPQFVMHMKVVHLQKKHDFDFCLSGPSSEWLVFFQVTPERV